nr:pca operon transcription factor PcaQ [uncultured Pseudomonas sp.]
MNIDTRSKFRHLVIFIEVARQGSLAKASHKLAISQPALSKALKELEGLLSARLFVGGKTGAALTDAGIAFMRYAAPSIQALREGINSMQSGEHEPVAIRLEVLSTVESILVPDVICRLHASYPALVVSVTTGPSAYLLSLLRMGGLDLVVGRMTGSPEILGLSFEHLYCEPMTIVMRAGHPLLTGDSSHAFPEDFPHILPLAGTTIRKFADSLFVQHGIQAPRQRLETLSLTLSRRYVQCSDAAWIAPFDAVRQDVKRGELVELDLGIREQGGSVGLCSNPVLPLSTAAQWFVEALQKVGLDYKTSILRSPR